METGEVIIRWITAGFVLVGFFTVIYWWHEFSIWAVRKFYGTDKPPPKPPPLPPAD